VVTAACGGASACALLRRANCRMASLQPQGTNSRLAGMSDIDEIAFIRGSPSADIRSQNACGTGSGHQIRSSGSVTASQAVASSAARAATSIGKVCRTLAICCSNCRLATKKRGINCDRLGFYRLYGSCVRVARRRVHSRRSGCDETTTRDDRSRGAKLHECSG